MNTLFSLSNIRTLFFVILAMAIIWLYKDWQWEKSERIRQEQNISSIRKSDSLRFTTQVLNKREIEEYLNYENQDLKNKLSETGIKLNRIESIVSTKYTYQDNTPKQFDLNPLLQAIKENKELTVPFTDTTKCMTITGNATFKNDSLKINITDKQFKNKSDAVAYWQRRQWKFLFFKTRFLGKKEFTAKTFDDCGKSQVMKIEKKKD